MQSWMYGLIAVPVIAVTAAYGLGAFSVDKTSPPRSTSFMGDNPSDDPISSSGTDYGTFGGKRKRKTKKSSKKTTRRK